LTGARLFRFIPPEASSVAPRVDRLVLILLCCSILIVLAVFTLIIYFAIRYRNGAKTDRSHIIHNSTPIEIGWTVATSVVFFCFFGMGLATYYDDFRPPANAMDIFVVGKQWMWKTQHPDGRREINQLHLPVGQEVRLSMISEDVIHDFFIPAFRIKKDVLPGRYTEMTFMPTKPGVYHLFCSQYCGPFHANMVGQIIVMNAPDYQRWLAETAQPPMAREGQALFRERGCVACHQPGGRGPQLAGLPGRFVHLSDGSTLVADDSYIRESIVAPATKIVAGYDPIMPTFQGQLSEQQIQSLIEYIKSLGIEEQERTHT